jgi:hypothetical protein
MMDITLNLLLFLLLIPIVVFVWVIAIIFCKLLWNEFKKEEENEEE